MQKVKEIVKRWWGAVAVFFSIAVLVGGVVLVQRPKETKRSEAAAATQISINPSAISKSTAETFTVNIDIDTGENTVSAAYIEIAYDTEKLEGISITAGNYLPVVLTGGQIGSGKATITLGSQPTDPKQGTGTLATIEFKVLGNNTTTDISISANAAVAAIGEDGNVLVGRNSSTVTMGTSPGSLCGGIQGLACPSGSVCIYADGSQRVPSPDASGTCQEACSSDNDCQEIACPGGEPVHEICADGQCIQKTQCAILAPTEAPTEPPTTPPTEAPTVAPTEAASGEPTIPPTEPPTTGQNGDVNNDNVVNIVDIGIIIDDYGSTSPTNPGADLNDDGVVNIVDIGIVIDNYQ